MKPVNRGFAVLALLLCLGMVGCSGRETAEAPATSAEGAATSAAPIAASTAPVDYSQAVHWLDAPTSTPLPVDVFYVYPTAYSKTETRDPDICSIDNPTMVAGAKAVFQRQATAFAPLANIYAPYYRQVCIPYQLALSHAKQDAVIAGQPGTDVTAAFEYYLQNYNHGRPFILVGHSQGSAVLAYLLSTYMKAHPDVYKRMIAAYVVGYSITPQYLAQNSHLKYATGASDTGVIISWNTEAPTVKGTSPVTRPGGIAMNPITWTTGEATATAKQNLGSIELNMKTGQAVIDGRGQPRRVMGLADARVDKARGVIVCSTVKPADYFVGFPEGVYHTFDYPFYYFDVRANAAHRIRHYLAGSR
jgi:pimeloyl-ACP methyl ester carboxylesterase